MSTAVPGITAGYDATEPRAFTFPAAAAHGAPPADVDRTLLGRQLADALTTLCGMPVNVAAMAETGSAPGRWRAASGAAFAIGGGQLLAAALLSRQCGGAFEAGPATRSTHVERCRMALAATLRDLLLPAATGWETDETAPARAACAFAVEVGPVHDRIDIVALPPVDAPAELVVDDGWHARLCDLLAGFSVPVRLVLHEGAVAVRAARALAVGDVLPISTAHEVGLRVDTLALARGHMIDTETGTPRVRIVARGRRTEGA